MKGESYHYLRVLRFGSRQQSLDRQQSRLHVHGRCPLVLQNIQTDGSGLLVKDGTETYHTADIRVPHLRHERHHGRHKRISIRNVAMDLEEGAFENRVLGTENEENEIVLRGRLPQNTQIGICFLMLTNGEQTLPPSSSPTPLGP